MLKNTRWTEEEDLQLINELSKNMDISNIATKHGRTILCINFRRRVIAYNMYKNNIKMEEIQNKTKLDIHMIQESIDRRQRHKWRTSPFQHRLREKDYTEKGIEIIKKEVRSLKSNIQEIVEMMNAIYEFEES